MFSVMLCDIWGEKNASSLLISLILLKPINSTTFIHSKTNQKNKLQCYKQPHDKRTRACGQCGLNSAIWEKCTLSVFMTQLVKSFHSFQMQSGVSHLSRWDMTVLLMSPPASWRIRMTSAGAAGFLPGWMMTGQPSWAWAWAVALSTFFSLCVMGQLVPISPITPQRMSVPSAPWSTSLTMMSVSWCTGS